MNIMNAWRRTRTRCSSICTKCISTNANSKPVFEKESSWLATDNSTFIMSAPGKWLITWNKWKYESIFELSQLTFFKWTYFDTKTIRWHSLVSDCLLGLIKIIWWNFPNWFEGRLADVRLAGVFDADRLVVDKLGLLLFPFDIDSIVFDGTFQLLMMLKLVESNVL